MIAGTPAFKRQERELLPGAIADLIMKRPALDCEDYVEMLVEQGFSRTLVEHNQRAILEGLFHHDQLVLQGRVEG